MIRVSYNHLIQLLHLDRFIMVVFSPFSQLQLFLRNFYGWTTAFELEFLYFAHCLFYFAKHKILRLRKSLRISILRPDIYVIFVLIYLSLQCTLCKVDGIFKEISYELIFPKFIGILCKKNKIKNKKMIKSAKII